MLGLLFGYIHNGYDLIDRTGFFFCLNAGNNPVPDVIVDRSAFTCRKIIVFFFGN